MARFSGTVSKIFVRPASLFGSGNMDTDQNPPVPVGPYQYGVSYEAVAVTSAGNLVYETIDVEAGAYQFQMQGAILLNGNSAASGTQAAITDDVRSYFGTPNATVIFITDYKGIL